MKKYRDHYFNRAKQENYPARSVYKLQEIQKRFKLFSKGMTVLDLGAAPGSWSLFAAKAVGPKGSVLAVDLQKINTDFPAQVTALQENVFERSETFENELAERKPFDMVISDMAPKTTGIKFRDQALSVELCREALALASTLLIQGGHFVVKIFESGETKEYMDEMRQYFGKVRTFKPKSSRVESKETFVIGLVFKGETSS